MTDTDVKTQHSPGPWKAMPSSDRTEWWIDSQDGEDLALIYELPNAEANARLIAAAPELLERLREHVLHSPGICGDNCPSCGRDNKDFGGICDAEDCIGVMDRAAIAKTTTC
ncbi:MAG: hypothetical protein JKX85_06215 [Phycisphaeraceae bacterium]|nr:hypothetical protein [Phycisphaeraceae bacterium]